MTAATLTQAFQTMRDNLKAMGQAALPDSIGTYPYVVKWGNTYPIIDFIVQSGSTQKTSETTQDFTVNLRMQITVAEFQQGYEGQAQDAMQFTILPTVIQYFEEHGGISMEGHSSPAYLDRLNTRISSFQTTVSNGKLVIVLNWTVIFKTAFRRKC